MIRHKEIEAFCPECSKPEKIKTICVHCGYKYEEDDDCPWIVIIGFFVAVLSLFGVLFWFVATLSMWFSADNSLVEVLTRQWEWLLSRRIW